MGELTGHSKRVTDAKFLGHQDLMVTTSADKTSRLWAVDGDAYKCKVSCSHCLKLCFRESERAALFFVVFLSGRHLYDVNVFLFLCLRH